MTSWRRDRWGTIRPWPHAVIAGVVLVLLAAGTVPLTNVLIYTPENSVSRYLGALAEGDAGKALALVSSAERSNPAAMTSAVLTAAPSLPSSIRVGEARRTGEDTATVEASFYLNQSTRTTTFALVRDTRLGGLWNHWQIDADSLPSVTINLTGADTVQVNTVDVEVGSGTLQLLPPAVYSIGYSSPWLASEPTRLDVTSFDQQEELPVVPEPTAEMLQEVEGQLATYLADCAEQTTLAPSGCPFSYGTEDEILGEVAWTIDAVPSVRLDTDEDGFLMPAARGQATVKGRARDIVTAEERDLEERVDFYLGATVTVAGDALNVIPRESLLGG